MTSKQPDIVFFFWDNLGWGEAAATALKKGQAGLIAIYATNMADQNDRDHKSLVDAVASGRITAEPDM